tara:strand:- start:49 stop:396 length:348 start_codon:yes stop_codon:yes gene_type:complete
MKNNNKPFIMKPGSREVNTPGTFRADSKAMLFKPMQTNQEKAQPKIKEKPTPSSIDSTRIIGYKNFLKLTPDEKAKALKASNSKSTVAQATSYNERLLKQAKNKFGAESVRNIRK